MIRGSSVYDSLEELWDLFNNEDTSYLLDDLKERVEGVLTGGRKPFSISWVSTESDYAVASALGYLTDNKEGEKWSSSEGEEFYKMIKNEEEGILLVEISIPGMTDYLVINF